MAEGSDDASKTEEPSQKRLDEARKKGQMVSSRELNHFFMMLALTFFIFLVGPRLAMQCLTLLTPFITQPDMYEMSPAGILDALKQVSIGTGLILVVPLAMTFAAALAPSVIQGKWVFAVEQIRPKFEKISPLAGFKRMFSIKSLVEFLKSFLKIMVIGIVALGSVRPYMTDLPGLGALDKADMLIFARAMAGRMMIAACIFLFLLSIFDYVYQRFVFLKSMRMSKQELKDEHKQSEGDPHIKGKVKQMRRERARKRMMASVPKADVIITNPTHYAIALKYDSATMKVPKVLAKGTDELAARIRELAGQHKIPIVRNPPLARMLYDTAEIDDDIPVAQYQAVAKIIGYVYKLKGKPLTRPTVKKARQKK